MCALICSHLIVIVIVVDLQVIHLYRKGLKSLEFCQRTLAVGLCLVFVNGILALLI